MTSLGSRSDVWADLDRSYLDPRIRELADSLEKPELLARWSTIAGKLKN